jgi:hypothetical protein
MLKSLIAVLLCCSVALASGLSFEDVKAQAESGDVRAMFSLALRYDNGRDTPMNKAEALRWYRTAAEGGLALAQNSLGSMYQAGEGVERDYERARVWYQKATDQGDAEATNNLAFLYDEGLGLPEDNAKAIELYTLAAERGYLRAMLNLGVMYSQGDGVPNNNVEAYKWLDLARFYTQTSDDRQLKWRSRAVLDGISKKMSAAEVAAAKKLTIEWDASHRKNDGT